MVSIKNLSVRALPLSLALLASACTVVPYEQARQTHRVPSEAAQPTAPKPREQLVVPQQPSTAPAIAAPSASLPAAQRMRQLASVQGEQGEYKRAIALLERALRISPRDPETYYELARNHLLLQEAAQAMQLAQRGLSLNPSTEQRERLERLLDDCRAALSA